MTGTRKFPVTWGVGPTKWNSPGNTDVIIWS